MYRPFRDFLNDRLSAAVSACCPGFVESKSLARAGGFTRRCKLADGRAVYIFMTTVPQRERFMLSLGWAPDGRFKAWEDLASQVLGSGRQRIEHLRKTARLAPATLWQVLCPGILMAADVRPGITVAEIDISDGVPWQTLACHLADSSEGRIRLAPFLDPFILDSLLRGEVPPFAPPDPRHGLNEPYRCDSPMVSWETLFEFVLNRPPSTAELESLTVPALAEAMRHLDALAAVANALVGPTQVAASP